MKIKYLSFAAILAVNLHGSDFGTIEVTGKKYDEVNSQEVKSADLAEVLAKKSSSVSLIRRSAVANDVLLRGQKRDNIRITIDDAAVFGACPNRMDPPTSHAITTNIETVEINEGPFDVTELGVLSGSMKIKTPEPSKELGGEVGVTIGSYDYKKASLSVSGGNDSIQLMVVASKEESEQYEDGDGRTLAEQTKNIVGSSSNPKISGNQYVDKYEDMKAYEKQSIMVKSVIKPAEDHKLVLSATKNESDDILYPSSGMDAIYDDSNIYNMKYTVENTSEFSDKLELDIYKSDVDHPMSTMYRVKGTATEMTNHLKTDAKGVKISNKFNLYNRSITVGIDTSSRNWDGHYSKSGAMNAPFISKSINDTDTENRALFIQCRNSIGDTDIKLGARYDTTDIDTAGGDEDNSFTSLSANIFLTHNLNANSKLFFGIGQGYRVPDARELYFIGMSTTGPISIGTENLEQIRNREIDFGGEYKTENGKIKTKLFYSMLDDYIYYQKSMGADRFKNIDGKIYGFEIDGAYYLSDILTFNGGYSYKIGKKSEALSGQSDKDLADITPPKLNIGLVYDHDSFTTAELEMIHVDKWSNYDKDNGEQEIDGYSVVNLKAEKDIEQFKVIVGVDNIFDKTFAVSNTYADLTLLSDGSETMLLNEPGRYFYANIKYKF